MGKTFLILIVTMFAINTYGEDPGDIDYVNPEILIEAHRSFEDYPFYIFNSAKIFSFNSESAVIEIKAIFDAVRCINNPPSGYLVKKERVRQNTYEVKLIGKRDKYENASLNGICSVVNSPTKVKFYLKVDQIVGDKTNLIFLFKDRFGSLVKELQIIQADDGVWTLI